MDNIALGMKRDTTLEIVKLSHHQYYYKNKSGKAARPASEITTQKLKAKLIEVSNETVVQEIEQNHQDPDLSYGYRRMTSYL